MNWLDIGIIIFLIASVVRGIEIGFVRQFFSTAGFLSGLLLGVWLQGKLIALANSPGSKALLVILVVLGCAVILMTAGEYLGLRVKFKIKDTPRINRFDRVLGSFLAAATLLAAVWIGAAIFRNAPSDLWQRQINSSRIIRILSDALPQAPDIVTQLGHFINPNVFPQVFTGLEPELPTDTSLPDLGSLNSAVQSTKKSVVKIQGTGCGGVVTGTGFVADPNLVMTNAHVVAGVDNVQVVDANGSHDSTVVWFDPDLDIAVLRTNNLAGKPLGLNTSEAQRGTAAIAPGYPENSGFTVRPASILETFNARGRDIYNQDPTERQVYAINADIRQGNSGGPLIIGDGSVIGVIFAKSTTYDNAGYALTAAQAAPALDNSTNRFEQVSTGKCAQ